ncbi:hypothetical protein Barb4_05506 [Bacteroidales bacterium Barb4]|nr:hypothetical protein Barb4_05506 [Bacteroidales bacterium Barb4]
MQKTASTISRKECFRLRLSFKMTAIVLHWLSLKLV